MSGSTELLGLWHASQGCPASSRLLSLLVFVEPFGMWVMFGALLSACIWHLIMGIADRSVGIWLGHRAPSIHWQIAAALTDQTLCGG